MYESIIIGAGIAGCTAAIYASRKRMEFLLISKTFGGQFYESGEILNYPGITSTDGVAFGKMFEDQLKANSVSPRIGEEVKKIEAKSDGFELFCDGKSYETKTVIIATGSGPRRLNVPGEKEYAAKGVTYCSICDGPLFSGKDIAVIGGGNSALEGVDFTKAIARKIYLINKGADFTGHEILIEKIKALENVEIINEADTIRIYGDRFVSGLKYTRQGKEYDLSVKGVIVEIGRIPNTGFLEGFVELTDKKHVVIDCQARTSREGVFAAGDCASGDEFQYALAAGQGCIAILKAARYLANKKG